MKLYKLSHYVSKCFETSGSFTEWGGYYNYDFLSADGKKMLCHRTDFDNRQIKKGDIVQIGWYDIETGVWHEVDVSDSFNWQQGSMLQWLPGSKDKKIIYNISKNGKLISRITNVETGEKEDLCFPVYGITPDGKKSITLDLERSYWTIAYHYQSVENNDLDVNVVETDGIFSLDLENNRLKKIIAIRDVMALDYKPEFENGKHWLEHIMINREGTKFVFLHRFNYNNIGRTTRMIIADIDGSNLKIVKDWDKFSWSHFGWKTETEFAMYAIRCTAVANAYSQGLGSGVHQKKTIKQKAIRFARKIYKTILSPIVPMSLKRRLISDGAYQIYSLKNGEYILEDRYSGKLMDIDGHPSFAKNGKYMITDSYADEKRFRRLIVWNTKTKKGILIGRFYAPLWGSPAACDLHPKLSKDEQHLVIDTAYSGRHRMMVLNINWKDIYKKIG